MHDLKLQPLYSQTQKVQCSPKTDISASSSPCTGPRVTPPWAVRAQDEPWVRLLFPLKPVLRESVEDHRCDIRVELWAKTTICSLGNGNRLEPEVAAES
jgi:hypothetical protein